MIFLQIALFCDLLLVVAFFLMEDIYSRHESASSMRDFLTLGIVLRCMDNAFRIGLRSAAARVAEVFSAGEGENKNPYTTLESSYRLMSGSLQWVSTLRRIAFMIGVYMVCQFDALDDVIGASWRTIGYLTAAAAAISCVFDFGRIFQNQFFSNYYCE